MNEWNEMERQLRSWKPRPPSAGLEQRIFGVQEPRRPESEERRPVSLAAWLVPAMPCFLAALLLAHSYGSRPAIRNPQAGSMPAALVTGEVPSYWSGISLASINLEQNVLPRFTFSSTNEEHSPSSMVPFPEGWTNNLNQ